MAKRRKTEDGEGAAKAAPMREWESEYPEFPDLIGDQRLSDCDAIFREVASDDMSQGVENLFHAAILTRFIQRVATGESVERFIMKFLADAFSKALAGAVWDEVIRLPGRHLPVQWGVRAPLDERDLRLFCAIENRRIGGVAVTAAIEETAVENAVSFETARSAYYKWRSRLSIESGEI